MSGRARVRDFALYAAFVPAGICTVMLGPLLPRLQGQWGIGDAQAGALFGAQFLASVAASAFVGLLARRFGYLRLIAIGMLLMASGTAMLGIAVWPAPVACVAVYGCGLGLIIPAGNLAVAALHAADSSRSVMAINLVWCIGAVAAPQIVARAPLWIISAACVAMAVLLARANEIRPAKAESARAQFSQAAAVTSLFLFIYVGTENSIAGWVASLGARAPETHAVWAALPSIFWAGILAGRATAPALLRLVKPPALLMAGLGAAFAGSALLPAHAGAVWTLVATAFCGLGLAPVFPLVVSQYADAEPTGTASSLIFTAGGIGGAAIPWAVGWVSESTGNLRPAMLVAVALVAIMGILVRLHAMALNRAAGPPLTGM